jgi:hypothetical protein
LTRSILLTRKKIKIGSEIFDNRNIATKQPSQSSTSNMGDFANFGGTDEENAEIRRLNADVVSCSTFSWGMQHRADSHPALRKRTPTTSRTGRS